MSDLFGYTAEMLNMRVETFLILILGLLIWKLAWYGFALYRAIDKRHKAWFILLFIIGIAPINDLGLLAIIYLLLYKDKKDNKSKISKKDNKKEKKS